MALAVAVTAPALWAARTLTPWARAALVLALAGLALWASVEWGATTGRVDDGRIVVDEVAGAALVLAALRPHRPSIGAMLLVGYIAIDRLKPWPVDRVETVPGALGVVLDDLAAAVLLVAAVLAWRVVARRLG